jgi:hypothetical protein
VGPFDFHRHGAEVCKRERQHRCERDRLKVQDQARDQIALSFDSFFSFGAIVELAEIQNRLFA